MESKLSILSPYWLKRKNQTTYIAEFETFNIIISQLR